MAGLASLHLMSACTETRYVIVSGDPQKYHGNNVTLQPVAATPDCVEAPIGYVIPQDKWDPYSIPCPPQVAIVAMRPGQNTPTNPSDSPKTPTPPTPQPDTPPEQVSNLPSGTKGSMTPTADGGTLHESKAGKVVASEVTYP
jgi:hypothetical protein